MGSQSDFNSKASGIVNQVNMASVEVEGRYRPNKRGFSYYHCLSFNWVDS